MLVRPRDFHALRRTRKRARVRFRDGFGQGERDPDASGQCSGWSDRQRRGTDVPLSVVREVPVHGTTWAAKARAGDDAQRGPRMNGNPAWNGHAPRTPAVTVSHPTAIGEVTAARVENHP